MEISPDEASFWWDRMSSNPSKSIAFFMPDLSGGGVERMRLHLTRGLIARGYDVTLILQTLRGDLRHALPLGLRLIVLDQHRVIQSVLPLAHVLQSLRPAFLISSLDHNNIAALCAASCARVQVRTIICQHNALSEERALGWKYRVVPKLYRLLSPLADRLIAVSHGVADDMAVTTGIARERITVVPNPVIGDPQHSECVPEPHPWRTDPGTPFFVFAGRLVFQKDPETLLRAFALLVHMRPARLVILGEGPMRGTLVGLAGDLGVATQVHFAGYVADPYPWMRAARAVILTSRYEGFANVIVEALACGTPVIATDCPHGPSEILAGGRFGVLVPVGNAQAMAAAMARDLRAIYPPGLLRGRAAAFSIDACVEQHEAIFQRLPNWAKRSVFGLVLTREAAPALANLCVATQPERLQLVVTPNLDHIRLLRHRAFAAAYASAAIVCADGFPLAAYAWVRRAGKARAITGCDIIHHVMRHAGLSAIRVAVVLESEATRKCLEQWLADRGMLGNWTIIVAPAAFSTRAEEQRHLAASVAAARPQIALVTLGAPTSETFVNTNRDILPPCWVLCVGQALRVEIGMVRRAPLVMRALGLEWAWRICQEPMRLLPRYLKAGLWFPLAVARDLLGKTPAS
jgi:exopolysaccharide biosynthesis WecB/TagA/CpsF family protein